VPSLPSPSKRGGREGAPGSWCGSSERLAAARKPPTTTLRFGFSKPSAAPDRANAAATQSLAAIAADASAFCSPLLNLTEFQLDGRRSAEDRYRDLKAGARLVHLLHYAIQGRRRPARHADLLPHPHRNPRP